MSHLTYAEAIITGIVQGVSELFPISSLGHNVLIPALIGGQTAKDLDVTATGSPYLAFVVALHVATAFAMILYFWRDWVRIIGGFLSSVKDRRIVTADQRLAWMIILGTIPVGLVGVVLQKVVTSVFAKPVLTALFLAVNGLILLYSERRRAPRGAGPEGEIGDDDWNDAERGRNSLGSRRSGRDSGDSDGGFWDDDRDGRRRGRGRRQPDADDERFDDELFGAGPHFGQDPRYAQDPRQGGDPRLAEHPRMSGGDPRMSGDARMGDGGRPGRPGPHEYDRDGYGPGHPGGYPDDRGAARAPGFQPAPGQPGGLGQPGPSQPGGFGQPGPSQPGSGRRGAAHGYGDPADDERTQVWNQQPGQQQWQGPDPRYDDPRYGQDPRGPRHRANPRQGEDPRDPWYGQEPPAAGQGPAFTPAFTPSESGPGGPSFDPPASYDRAGHAYDPAGASYGPAGASYDPAGPSFEPPAPGFGPRGDGQDPRAPQDPRLSPPDPRGARYPQAAPTGYPQDAHTGYLQDAPAGYPQAAPAAPAAGGGPTFTPTGPGVGDPGRGPGPHSARRAQWDDGPAADQWEPGSWSGQPGGFDGEESSQTRIDVVDLPQRYDKNDPNVAADRRLATMSFKQAVLVGAWQIAALLPGISRDGIVTVGGMRMQLRRDDAVRFSFLLSAPVLLAAGVLKLPDLTGPAGKGIMGPVVVGSLLSFSGAYISVRFLTKYFSESKSLKPFGYYCLAFGSIAFLFLLL